MRSPAHLIEVDAAGGEVHPPLVQAPISRQAQLATSSIKSNVGESAIVAFTFAPRRDGRSPSASRLGGDLIIGRIIMRRPRATSSITSDSGRFLALSHEGHLSRSPRPDGRNQLANTLARHHGRFSIQALRMIDSKKGRSGPGAAGKARATNSGSDATGGRSACGLHFGQLPCPA